MINGQILHPIDSGLHLLRPLCPDGGLSPRMNVTGSAWSEIVEAGLKAYRNAGTIRTALDNFQKTWQTSHRHKTLFVDNVLLLLFDGGKSM